MSSSAKIGFESDGSFWASAFVPCISFIRLVKASTATVVTQMLSNPSLHIFNEIWQQVKRIVEIARNLGASERKREGNKKGRAGAIQKSRVHVHPSCIVLYDRDPKSTQRC